LPRPRALRSFRLLPIVSSQSALHPPPDADAIRRRMRTRSAAGCGRDPPPDADAIRRQMRTACLRTGRSRFYWYSTRSAFGFPTCTGVLGLELAVNVRLALAASFDSHELRVRCRACWSIHGSGEISLRACSVNHESRFRAWTSSRQQRLGIFGERRRKPRARPLPCEYSSKSLPERVSR
jgi:hypothetical protein